MTISPISLLSESSLLDSAGGASSASGLDLSSLTGSSATSGATASGGSDFASTLDSASSGTLFSQAMGITPDNMAAALDSNTSNATSSLSSDPASASTSLASLLPQLIAMMDGGSTTSSGTSALTSLESALGIAPSTAVAAAPSSTPAGPSGADIVGAAAKYVGTPYVWGGEGPKGFDCSGLVQYVFHQFGISLPRTSEQQATAGQAVSGLGQAQPGDLLFFAGSDGTASSPGHVGIYIGNGKMIDAPHTGTDVQIQSFDPSSVVAIRRVLPDATSAPASPASATLPSVPGTTRMGGVSVPNTYVSTIEQAAQANGIPPQLLAALLHQESGFNPAAVSSAGAIGIAQFMPSTASGMGINPSDPTQAINGAAKLIGEYTQRFGNYADALAAYNAGPGAVEQYGGVPPYAQTQAYVPDILSAAQLSSTPGATT